MDNNFNFRISHNLIFFPFSFGVQKSFVKRFAWETYPQVVRVVCIGGDLKAIEENINGQSSFYSAELCGGNHLQQTEDLVDVVIVGLRSRNSFIKEVRRSLNGLFVLSCQLYSLLSHF